MRNTRIHIVSESTEERAEQARLCFELGIHAEIYSDTDELIDCAPDEGIALVRDPEDEGGVGTFMKAMSRRGMWLPVIAVSERPRPSRVVAAIKAGVLEYLTLPLEPERLRKAVAQVEIDAHSIGSMQRRAVEARNRLASLTPREREVLDLVSGGASNKVIARELEISPRTVEIHRANMMNKLEASHPADAVRLRFEASVGQGPLAYPEIGQPAAA